MPSASLGGKNQIPKPHVVVMTSNRNIHQIDMKLNQAAREALCMRMMVYEFCGPKYDPNVHDARQNQPHRQQDFSHITFRNDDGDSCTVDELIDEVCEKLGASFENFKKLSQSTVKPSQYMYNGKPLSVDKIFSADDIKFLHWFLGRPGTGTSHSVLPHVCKVAAMIKVGYHVPGHLSELRSIKPAIGDIFVLDDLFDMSCQTHQLLFIQWYNSLPAMCKIIALSNYGPDSIDPFSSVYRLRKKYKPSETSKLKLVLPHRLGFELSDEARCIVRTNGGWKDTQGDQGVGENL